MQDNPNVKYRPSLIEENPAILNRDPYHAGWMVRARPTHWDAECGRLVDAERLYVDAATAALDLEIDAVAAAIEARLAAGEDPLP